jgi:hypothetical protein
MRIPALRGSRAACHAKRRAAHKKPPKSRHRSTRHLAASNPYGGRRLAPVLAIVLGTLMAGSGAYALTQWVVSLNSGSSAIAKGAAVKNLTIAAISSPSPASLLYPDGTGDVVLQITNPNPFPVTITTIDVPSSSTYATGFSTSALTSAVPACDASASGSDVSWHGATTSASTRHVLASPLVVAATGSPDDPLTVTLTGAASMGATASATCEGRYFKMPSLVGVTAYAEGNAAATASPAADS